MAWRPQLYPPQRRITVHSLRLLHESLQPGEQPIFQISADFRDDPPLSGLAAFWLWLLEMWLYRLWCVCTWGEPRMLLVTDQRLLTAVSLELTEIPFAAVEDITLRRTWDEFGMEVGELVVTYEGGRRLHFRVCRPQMVSEKLQQAWERWKQQQQALVAGEPPTSITAGDTS